MTVHISSTDRLKVGDAVDHNGKKYTVAEAVAWSDAWGNFSHTEATLKLTGGTSESGEAGNKRRSSRRAPKVS